MILLTIIVLPVFLAVCLPFFRGHRTAVGCVGWLGALPAAVVGWSGVVLPETEFPFLFLGSVVALGQLPMVFLALAGLLWAVAGWFARSYLAEDPSFARFQAFFLLSMAGNFGLIVAADVITFYGCFVLMTFAAYGLVVHQGDKEARRAGRVYLIMSLIGEVLLLSALFLAVAAAGGLRLDALGPAIAMSPDRTLICVLAFLGFGVKAGAVPLYFWLPLAHPVAPTPASAVLSGSMIKAGLIGWLYLLPFGEAALPDGGQLLVVLGFVAAFGAALLGLCQQVPKTILAYSSISQMGLMTVLLGLGLIRPELWALVGPAVAVYALHHGLAKGALFLGVGVYAVWPERWRRLFWAGLLLPALAIAGAPLTFGALAKYGLKETISRGEFLNGSVLLFLLSLSVVTTSLLLGKFFWMLRHAPAQSAHGTFVGLSIPWGVLVLMVATAPFFVVKHFELALKAPSLSVGGLAAGLWPVVTGAVFLVVFLRAAPKSWRRLRVPAGDGIVLIERCIRYLRGKCWKDWEANWDQEFLNVAKLIDRIIAFESATSAVDRVEARLGSWNLFGFLLFTLLLGFLILFVLF